MFHYTIMEQMLRMVPRFNLICQEQNIPILQSASDCTSAIQKNLPLSILY